MVEDNRNCNCNCENNNTMELFENSNFQDNCNNEAREEMARRIKSLDFAIIELGLFLDTHSNDTRALCLHRKYANEVKILKDQYQKVYGPLTINFPCNKWRWIEEPWPWERGNF